MHLQEHAGLKIVLQLTNSLFSYYFVERIGNYLDSIGFLKHGGWLCW
jgi:hypothetical protein